MILLCLGGTAGANPVNEVTRRAMTLDGRLDDSVWTSVDWYGQPAAPARVGSRRTPYPVASRPLFPRADSPDGNPSIRIPTRLFVKVRTDRLDEIDRLVQTNLRRLPRRLFSFQVDRGPEAGEFRSWIAVETGDSRQAEFLASLLRQHPDVAAVEYDLVSRTTGTTPNDPRYPDQWYEPAIGAPEAWDVATGAENPVTIAVLDTGVDWRHPDIAPNLWINPGEDIDGSGTLTDADFNGIDDDGNGYVDDLVGWDFVDLTGEEGYPIADGAEDAYDEDNNPMDWAGHGTLVASTALAAGNNGLGMAGVAWNGRIMCLRVGYRDASEDGTAWIILSCQIDALVYAVNHGARVATLAFGSSSYSQIQADAVAWAARSGLVLCAGAGNDATDPEETNPEYYPAAYPKVIAVAGVGHEDERAYFEYSWYYWSWSHCGDWIDVAAPAEDILCAYPVSPLEPGANFIGWDMGDLPLGPSENEDYVTDEGTSLSCGIVAGAVALIASKYPEADAQELIYRLLASADDIDEANPGLEGAFGAGRINVGRALKEPVPIPGVPAFRAVEMTGRTWDPVRLVHTVTPGWTYQVEVREGPGDVWVPVGEPVTAVHGQFEVEWFDDGGDGAWIDPGQTPRRVYRIGRLEEDPGDPPQM